MAASFVDNGHRAIYDFTASDEYAIHFEGGQYTEYVFAGPDMPEILAAYTWLTGRMALPAAVGARLPPVPLVHATRRTRSRRSAPATASCGVPCDVLWLDIDYMDGYRVFTWDREAFPDAAGDARPARARQGFRVITIVDPGVKAEPGYEVFDRGLERDVLLPHRGRRRLHRPGLAGRHGVPGLRDARRRARGGAS